MTIHGKRAINTPLPSAVGLTHLKVYDTPAPDGHRGGSPHVHCACTECYYVQGGHGRVQTLSATDGFEETDLVPGDVVWFAPGVIHRLINLDGMLEIFVVMQNSGLPEAGDFVLTMPREILTSKSAYSDAASLSPHGEVFAHSVDAAYRRRDLAVSGFIALCDDVARRGSAPLEEFYVAAIDLIRSKVEEWEAVWRNGPLASATTTGQILMGIRDGRIDHLMDGALCKISAPSGDRRLGMCGTLGVYLPEGVTVAQRINTTGEEVDESA